MADIIISKELCKGCVYCVEFCPVKCLSMGDQFNARGFFYPIFENEEKCTGCGACACLCPDFAIEVTIGNVTGH